MKKFTLFLLTALFAVSTTFAQQLPVKSASDYLNTFNVSTPHKGKLNASATISIQNVKKDVRHQQLHGSVKTLRHFAKRNLAPAKAPTILTDEDVPNGEEKMFAISYDGYIYTIFGLMQASENGAVARFVFTADGSVYWKDPMAAVAENIWIKGSLEGNTITFELPQCMIYYSGYGYGLNYSIMDLDAETQTYVLAEDQNLVLTYENGQLSMASAVDGSSIIGISYTDDFTWAGYGFYNVSFDAVTETPVEVPEAIEVESYALTGLDADGAPLSYALGVGFDGNDVYIQGLYADMPEAWVKGTIEGDKAVFSAPQYIGADTHFQYLISASIEKLYDDYYEEYYSSVSLEEGDVVFNYDAATKTLTTTAPFVINAGKTDVSYAIACASATILPFTEVAATPATPEWNEIYEGGFSYALAGYGWGYLSFNVNNVDVDGNFILPDKITYQVYTKTNGLVQPLVFSANDYEYLDEDMTEVSLGFTEGWDFYVSGAMQKVYYYVAGPEAYGIQAIYRGAGEERRSEIAWMEVETIGAGVQPEIASPEYPAVDPENVGSSVEYGYFTGEENVDVLGFSKPESYDVAMKIDDPALVGLKIESISFPLISATNVSNISGWISTQLCIDENGKNVPDLASKKKLTLGLEEGMQTVKLDVPYTIPEGGVYVGYSFTVTKITGENDDNNLPVAYIASDKEEALFIHSSHSLVKWVDCSEALGGAALITVTVSGKSVKENAADVAAGEIYTQTGEAYSLRANIINQGAQEIASLDVDYEIAGVKSSQHIDLDEPIIAFLGKTAVVNIDMPALSVKGNYDLKLNVTKVNGVENEAASHEAIAKVIVFDVLPKHRALLEEYTGTWCGYCPRGFMGLELMNQLYGKDFVGVSYHNSDPMEIMPASDFPSDIEGFPAAWLDRVKETDAYCGDGAYQTFGIDKTYEARCEVFGFADLQVSSTWNAAEDAIEVNAVATFPIGYNDGQEYRLSYILVENGLQGDGSDWSQSNYYGGDTGWPEDMNIFTEGESYVSGLVFNDVAVAVSDYLGMGVRGSLPEKMAQDGSADNSYVFELANVVNTSGENLVQDKNQLYVVVLLINAQTGEVLNAIKEKVGQSSIAGINTTASAFDAGKTTEYFDAAGRSISTPQRGINFKKVTYSDGTQRVIKTFVK